ncbi:MAG TPA: hypothetical protein ENI23_02295 [bacterium]|nr:hypothetical protein [bacterium]
MELLKKLRVADKNKKNVQIAVTVALVLVSVLLFYFVGVKFASDFASSSVLEYKFENVNLNQVESKVREISDPVKIEKSDSGTIRFFFQNISGEDFEKVDILVGEEYGQALVRESHELIPVFDNNLEYRYTGILISSLVILAVISFIELWGFVKFMNIVDVIFTLTFSLLFEAIVLIGAASLLSLIGVSFPLITIQAGLFLVVFSILIKFYFFHEGKTEIKEKDLTLRQMWLEELKKNKIILFPISALVGISILPFIFIGVGITLTMIMSLLAVFILAYSNVIVVPQLLSIRSKKR